MKTVSLIIAFLISVASLSQQTDFTVAAGAQRTLTAAERTLSLKNLSLGDDCTIIIPASMDGWTVTATDVTIGRNVKIIGAGSNGVSGNSGSNGANGATCMNGGSGISGTNGSAGTAGKNISLSLRIRKIESLLINVTGGNGGNGGYGGLGGRGGNATCTCNAGMGGSGGNSGRGGSGGPGGTVKVLYSSFGTASVSNSNFIIQNIGGKGGMNGAAGTGGAGGLGGGCSDPKALTRTAGAAGRNGLQAPASTKGADGVTTLQKQ